MAERVSVLISTMVVLVVLLACGTRKEKSEDPPPPAPSVAVTTLLPPSASAVPFASTRETIATQPLPKPKRVIPKCTGDDRLYALDEKSAPFCAADDSCSSDGDCKGTETCVDAIVLNDDGSPALTHNGAPMGGKICKRR